MLPAVITRVRLLSRVRPHVCGQVTLPREMLPAVITLCTVSLQCEFARMWSRCPSARNAARSNHICTGSLHLGHLVFCQGALFRETLPAGIALVRLHLLLSCVVKVLFQEKHCPQLSHFYGFSPVWVLSCAVKWCFSKKRFPRLSNAVITFVRLFSRVGLLMHVYNWSRCPSARNAARSISHLYGFSLVWVLSCVHACGPSARNAAHSSRTRRFSHPCGSSHAQAIALQLGL